MSIFDFISLLITAAEVDRTTVPERHPWLLNTGRILVIAGTALVIVSVLITRALSFAALLGATLLLVGSFLLLSYGLFAKLYAQIGLVLICLFFGGCFGAIFLIRYDSYPAVAPEPRKPSSPLSRRLTHAGQSTIETVPANTVSAERSIVRATPPNSEITPRKRPVFEQVYVAPGEVIFHHENCPYKPKHTYRFPRSVAVKEGLHPADDCANLLRVETHEQ